MPYLMGVTHGASRPSQEDGAVSTTGGGVEGGRARALPDGGDARSQPAQPGGRRGQYYRGGGRGGTRPCPT